jgi:hypothetical protein
MPNTGSFTASLPPVDQPSSAGIPGLRPFSLLALLSGTRVYAFDEFYLAKNALLRYDERQDYLNYGYWAAGEGTANPSAALVLEMAKAAGIGPGSIVVTRWGRGWASPIWTWPASAALAGSSASNPA